MSRTAQPPSRFPALEGAAVMGIVAAACVFVVVCAGQAAAAVSLSRLNAPNGPQASFLASEPRTITTTDAGDPAMNR
jgi:hypothetical protein